MKRCVVYVRVSTTEQAGPGHHSVEAQEILCRRYADANGFQVIDVLKDEGYSGLTTKRPGLIKLTEYTSKHSPEPIDAILVQDTSRMGRDTTEYLLFRRQLRECGIDLVPVTQPNIDSSAEGRLVDTILAGINQYQSEEKGRRVEIAMRKKFEEGYWPSTAPLGYRNVQHEDGKRRVETDPDRFPLIQFAFKEYTTGHYSQDDLQEVLTEKGLRDRRNLPLSHTSLNQLLANPFYWGQMCWKGDQRMGKHEPAADRRTWERCQAVTAEHNRYLSRSRKHVFLLTGLTMCVVCGKHHTHSVIRQKRKRYYHCPGRAKCSQPYVGAEDLEEQVAEFVKTIHLTDDFIERVVAKVREVFANRTGHIAQEQSVLLRRKAILEQQRNVLEQKLLSAVLTDEAFQRHIPRITGELDTITRRLEDLEASRRLDTDALREILLFARDIPAAYAEAPPSLKKQQLSFMFREFRVRDRRIIEAVPTELFAVLYQGTRVRSSVLGCPRLNVVRTVISLLSSAAWVDKQRQLMRDAGWVAAC